MPLPAKRVSELKKIPGFPEEEKSKGPMSNQSLAGTSLPKPFICMVPFGVLFVRPLPRVLERRLQLAFPATLWVNHGSESVSKFWVCGMGTVTGRTEPVAARVRVVALVLEIEKLPDTTPCGALAAMRAKTEPDALPLDWVRVVMLPKPVVELVETSKFAGAVMVMLS